MTIMAKQNYSKSPVSFVNICLFPLDPHIITETIYRVFEIPEIPFVECRVGMLTSYEEL